MQPGENHAASPDTIRLIEDNYIECWSNFGRRGGELYQDDEIDRVVSRIPYLPYNGVIRTHCRPEQIDARIEANKAFFKQRGIPMLWAVLPSSTPSALPERLEAHGFERVEQLTGMSAGLDRLPETVETAPGIVIRQVDDQASLRDYVAMIVWRWHLPPDAAELVYEFNRDFWMSDDAPGRHWLAYQDGAPVAKAFAYLGKETVGIYGVATRPEARRQGIGAGITLAAYRASRKMGFRTGVLHSTAMGIPVYQRLGFEPGCQLHMFALS